MLKRSPSQAPEVMHDPTQLHVQICLGGAGKEAGLRQWTNGFVLRFMAVFRILFIDTDKKDVDQLPKWMKFLMNDFPAAAFLDHLEANPDQVPGSGLTDRLSQYRQGLGGSESITAGLQTFRQLGWPLLTFYLCRYAAEFFYFLLAPFQELHAFAADLCTRRGQGNIQDRLRVVVTLVFSSCGGTGSSLGLLIANLLHYLLPHRGGYTRYSVEADILLPGPMTHKAVNIGLLLANSYATLREVQAPYATPHQPLPDIELGPVLLSRRQPFTHIYLYDGINLGGYTFKERQHVCDIRNAVYEQRNFGLEGAEYGSRLADIHFQYPQIFSAASASIWEYDPIHTISDMGYQTAQAYLMRLTRVLPEAVAQQRANLMVDDFLTTNPTFLKLPAFTSDESGKPLQVSLAVLRKQPLKQLPPLLNHRLRQVHQHWQTSLNALVASAVNERSKQVATILEELLVQEGGFYIAQAWLHQLITRLQVQQASYQAELEQAKSQVAKYKREAQTQSKGFRQWWPFGRSSAYLMKQQRLLDASLGYFRHEAHVRVLAQLRQELATFEHARSQFQETLITFLKFIMQHHQEYMADYARRRSIAIQSVVCPDQAADWYRAGEKAALAHVNQQLRPKWTGGKKHFDLEERTSDSDERSCLILSEEGITRHIAVCQQPWQHLEDKTVESILHEQGRTAEDIYADMESAAAPLVSLAEVRQIPAAQRLLVLATETAHFFADLPVQTGLSVIATGNSRRISLLYTIHGLALEHLMKSDGFRSAYDQALEQDRSLHIYPDDDTNNTESRPKKRRGFKSTGLSEAGNS